MQITLSTVKGGTHILKLAHQYAQSMHDNNIVGTAGKWNNT
jgi:hypothetical protein